MPISSSQPNIRVVVKQTPDDVAATGKDWLIGQILVAIAERGYCTIALSGGSTPKKMYEMIGKLPGDVVDWKRVFLFWGDERMVPHEHLDSNYRMVRESWLDRSAMNHLNVYPVPTELEPAKAASTYESTIMNVLAECDKKFGPNGSDWNRMDVVLLGLGDDAHTASLFPETTALDVSDRWVTENWVEKLKTTRITLTAPFINRARYVAFLVCGASKVWALDKIFNCNYEPKLYPAQLIKPKDGDLIWFLDSMAASS